MDDRKNLMSPRPLSASSQIDRYKIREVLSMGSLGITYRAYDSELDREVAIREYLPTSFALRHTNYSVKPISRDHEKRYVRGRTNFLKVAKTLDQFSHDNIVKVLGVIETNNTAYMVMVYEYGVSLDSIINQCGTLEQNHLTRIFFPIFEGLQKIHELGFVHGSIKPSNIRIRETGSPVLLDFGSARQTSLRQPIESTALVNQGYLPLEQYSADYGEQGPGTDIYSLAAIMFQGVTGAKPDEALSRSDYLLRGQPDTVQELSAKTYQTYQQNYLSALHAGLTLKPQFRPQSLTNWQSLFEGNLQAYNRRSANATSTSMDHASKTASFEHNSSAPANNTGPHHDTIQQPAAEPISATTNEINGELDNLLESTVPDEADNELLNSGVLASQSKKQKRRVRSPVVGSVLAASIAVVLGIIFLQINGTFPKRINSASDSNSLEKIENDASALAIDQSISVSRLATGTATDTPTTGTTADVLTENTAINSTKAVQEKVVLVEPVEPTIAALSKVYFDKPVSNDPQSASPRTLSEIAKSTSLFSPVEGMEDEFWKDKGCSDCHIWTRESLCQQGEFYFNGDDSKISRIQHPFDGYFKLALKNWASNDCR